MGCMDQNSGKMDKGFVICGSKQWGRKIKNISDLWEIWVKNIGFVDQSSGMMDLWFVGPVQ